MTNKNAIHVLSRAVIVDQGHILLAYDPRSQPEHHYELNAFFYYLPGGHIEFKESCHDALMREIEEETGYRCQNERFLGIVEHAWHFPGDDRCCHTHEINFIFKANIPQINPMMTVAQKEDNVAFQWLPLKQLESIDLRPTTLKSLLPKWLELDMNEAFESVML